MSNAMNNIRLLVNSQTNRQQIVKKIYDKTILILNTAQDQSLVFWPLDIGRIKCATSFLTEYI